MSHRSNSQGRYGSQLSHRSIPYGYPRKRIVSNPQVSTERASFTEPIETQTIEIDRELDNKTPMVIVEVPGTWNQPGYSAKLPASFDLKKQAFQLCQAASSRGKTILVEVLDPKSRQFSRFKLGKFQDLEADQLLQVNDNLLKNLPYSSFQYITALQTELSALGFSVIPVKG